MMKSMAYLFIIFFLICILIQNSLLVVKINDISETLNQWELNEN